MTLTKSGASSDTDVVPTTREEDIEARIAELEAADVPVQQSLIEIRDNELATTAPGTGGNSRRNVRAAG